jgi:integrase/recombinase XerD
MKVHLRQRKQTKTGQTSLYLEYYKGTTIGADGRQKPSREYEYLNLYLIDKARSPFDKSHNKETLQLAESIRAKRELEIRSGEYGFSSGFKTNTNFIQYFKQEAEKRYQSKGNYDNWDSAIKHLIRYAGDRFTFKTVTPHFCEGFKAYLTKDARTSSYKPLSSSSAASYFNKFKACLKKAVTDRIIPNNPAQGIATPKVIENQREYLSLDELKAVARAECRYDTLKRAFLFSCLTGLRWSDIQALQWSQVRQTDEGWQIVFHQIKTKGLQYLVISEQARSYLGEAGKPDERVFIGLKYSSYMNVALQQWVMRAGITKTITFHCARHTFAVLQLTLGTEIYTLSKLLGHSELKTTQVYAKIIDEKKREAVNKIPDINI